MQCEPTNSKSKRESAECHAFQKCFADLACAATSGILNPGWLAVQLYSRELIGSDLRTEAQNQVVDERVKVEKLLSAVEYQIMASPATRFQEFLDILQNEPSLQDLATKLKNTYQELLGLRSNPSPMLFQKPGNEASVLPLKSVPSGPSLSTSSPSPPPTKQPKIDIILQPQPSLEHGVQPFFGHQDQQTSVGYTHSQFTACYNAGRLSAVDIYSSYLKSVYEKEKQPIYDKWPQVKSKKYINLALIEKEGIAKPEAERFMKAMIHGNIDDIKKSKQAIDIGQIAKLPDGSQPKCILVEGAPGVGKSTLAWKLCRKWGKGKLLQQYQLVVLLRLRDKTVRTAKNVSNLFQHYQHHIQQEVVKEIQDRGGKSVLLLLDGYDELPEELRFEDSIFLDIITGKKLPESTVLITSRPWASEVLHRECKRHISQHIEILGFTKTNIQSFLESITANDLSLLSGLKRHISCYPQIGSLMYIPLNSAFVVEVYRNSREDRTVVPKTMTDLYFSLVRDLLRCRWKVRSFSDLPQGIYQQLCELGRIAYEGIFHKRQVIFSDLPENFETLGLMQCIPELYAGMDATVSYNFLHLTVQEYLAAFYLSQQPVEEQIEHFRKHSADEGEQANAHFQMVLRFLSGMKFSEYPSEVLSTLRKHCAAIDGDELNGVTFDTLHWLFEAQDNDVIANVLGSSHIQFSKPCTYTVTQFDCFVLGYCVSHSSCTWRINLDFCYIGDERMEMLVRGALEKETHCRGGISELNLSASDITSEGVKYLPCLPVQLISKLEALYLKYNNLDSKSCAVLAHLISHVPHLKKLRLSFNPNIGEGGTVLLITSLTAQNSVERLDLYKTGIGVKDCQALNELLSLSTSLEKLDVSLNDLSPQAVELIISGLHHNTTLKRLWLRGSHFSLQNTISLDSVLRTNHTLTDLYLGQCDIDSDGACHLAGALCMNDTLLKLELVDNSIGIKGAAAFAEMLLKNKTLKVLDLRDDSIGKEGAQQLNDSLTHNNTVTLWLPKNSDLLCARSEI